MRLLGSEGHVALDRNPGPGYDTLLLRMIPGDLLSAFPHRQFHTLPGLLDSWAALPSSYPNACVTIQGGSLYHFYDGLWYDLTERQTHNLPCERRTRYRLSQPDTVKLTTNYDIMPCHCSSQLCPKMFCFSDFYVNLNRETYIIILGIINRLQGTLLKIN